VLKAWLCAALVMSVSVSGCNGLVTGAGASPLDLPFPKLTPFRSAVSHDHHPIDSLSGLRGGDDRGDDFVQLYGTQKAAITPLKIGQLYLGTLGSLFAVFIYTSPAAFLDAYRVNGEKMVEGTPGFELLKLVMKWWSAAIFSGIISICIAMNTGMPDKSQKDLLWYSCMWSATSSFFLTYQNYLFAVQQQSGLKKSGLNKDIQMGPIYFNIGMNVVTMLVAAWATGKVV